MVLEQTIDDLFLYFDDAPCFNPAVKLMINSCRSCDHLAQRASRDSRRDNRTPDVESSRAERGKPRKSSPLWPQKYGMLIIIIAYAAYRDKYRELLCVTLQAKRTLKIIDRMHYFTEKNLRDDQPR